MENILWCIGHKLQFKNIINAEGCYVYNSDGEKYLDLESGVWCLPLGHCNPEVNKAVARQYSDIAHTGYCYANPVINEAAGKILSINNFDNGKVIFLSSGSEAVEAGGQFIRKLTGKPKLLTLADSFLGSMGSSASKPKDEWVMLDWINSCDPIADLNNIDFTDIGGFVFEPGSSSGLVRFPSDELILAIANKIKSHSGFIQVNEITTGIGRTGKWFGYQHYSITPDIVSMGKGLGNGYPVSAVAMSREVADMAIETNFYHSQSHQNDPSGAAAALACLNTIENLGLIKDSVEKGAYLRKALNNLRKEYALIQEVRGRGLMTCLQFCPETDSSVITKLYERLLENKIIVANRNGKNAFRIDPPLIISVGEINHFISALDSLLKVA